MSNSQTVGTESLKKSFFRVAWIWFLNKLYKFIIRHPLLFFVIKRILAMIPIMLIVAFITIGMMELRPGDFLTDLRLNPDIKPETIQLLRQKYGLDKNVFQKYGLWLKNILHGELGYSMAYKMSVTKVIGPNLKNSMALNILSLILVYALAIPLGIVCAVKQFKWQDRTISFISFIFLSTPTYFFAFLLLYFAYVTHQHPILGFIKFPIGGLYTANWDRLSSMERFWQYIYHLILPVLALSLGGVASFVRFMRGQMLEELNKLYITTARAKGLKRNKIIYKHAFRNAVNPFISSLAGIFVSLVSGAVLTEIVMNFPGIGYIMYQGVLKEDLYLVMANFLLTALLTLFGIMISDILLSLVDPRIRIS